MIHTDASNDPLFASKGVIRYSVGNSHKVILECDQGIADYYYSMIPKWITVNRQKYRAHISIVRKETPPLLGEWGKYEGEEVEFHYSPIIRSGEIYYWLNVFCKRFEQLRISLGLLVTTEYTLPPNGFIKTFHMTIGNRKNEF